jgi:putative peptide zinc metalloprotease protein
MKRVVPPLAVLQAVFLWKNLSLVTQLHHRHPMGWELAILLVGSYSALLFHELGHAAACRRQGARVGPIGLSLYLVFPAFYTDVTDAWRLGRKERAVVDAAGIYFSLLAATIGAFLFLATRYRDFGLVAIACDVTVLFNINPFMRADGYWLISDGLGVPNLMALNRRMTVWLARRLIGRKDSMPFLLSQHRVIGQIYIAYYILFVAFVCWAGAAFYGWYLPHLFAQYPHLLAAASEAVRHGTAHAALGAAGRLLGATIPLVGLLTYLGRNLRRLAPRRYARRAGKAIASHAGWLDQQRAE